MVSTFDALQTNINNFKDSFELFETIINSMIIESYTETALMLNTMEKAKLDVLLAQVIHHTILSEFDGNSIRPRIGIGKGKMKRKNSKTENL